MADDEALERRFLAGLARTLGVEEVTEEALARSLGFDELTPAKLDQWFERVRAEEEGGEVEPARVVQVEAPQPASPGPGAARARKLPTGKP